MPEIKPSEFSPSNLVSAPRASHREANSLSCQALWRFAFLQANRHERSLEELKMTQQEIEELARSVAKLIRNSADVRQAIWDCACQCPNLTVEY